MQQSTVKCVWLSVCSNDFHLFSIKWCRALKCMFMRWMIYEKRRANGNSKANAKWHTVRSLIWDLPLWEHFAVALQIIFCRAFHCKSIHQPLYVWGGLSVYVCMRCTHFVCSFFFFGFCFNLTTCLRWMLIKWNSLGICSRWLYALSTCLNFLWKTYQIVYIYLHICTLGILAISIKPYFGCWHPEYREKNFTSECQK